MEETIAKQLETEEIAAYKKELAVYLEELPDTCFYEYFGLRPMNGEAFFAIRDGLRSGGHFTLLARFLERFGPASR